MTSDAPAIELDRLTRAYGDKVALDGVSLKVERGEIFGYLGPNGAGKTTTIKILTGLIKPSSGDARVGGASTVTSPLEVKTLVGYVPESGALFEKLTAREYLRFVGQLYGMADDAIEAAVLHWIGFLELSGQEDDRLGRLSRGNRQKVCWAAALIHDPAVLVLDEPLNGLDVSTVTRVKAHLRSLAAEGRTVFFSSHLVDVVERLCTRLGVIDGGRLVAEGSMAEILANAGASSLEEAMTRLCGRGASAASPS